MRWLTLPRCLLPLLGACLGVPAAAGATAEAAVPLDRLTWTHRNPYPTGQSFGGIVAGPACFIAFGEGGLVLRSVNGVLWDVVTLPIKASFIEGRFVEGEFLLVGESYLLTSPDGLDWKIRRLPQQSDGYWPTMTSAGRSGGRWAALANGGLYVSNDGEAWELWPFPMVAGYWRMAVGPDRILLLKQYFSTTTLVSVFASNNWVETPAPFLDVNAKFNYVDGQFVLSGPGTIATSPTGEQWEFLPLPPNAYYGSLSHSGARWTMVELNTGRFFDSVDLRAWTERMCDAFTFVGIVQHRAPDIWVAAGDTAGIATSTDAVHWIRRDTGVAPTMHAIARLGDRWVAVGQRATVMSSTDGLHWEQQVLGTEFQNFFNLVADDHVIYVKGEVGAFSTPDGVNWTPAAALPPTQWDFSGLPQYYIPWHTPTWVGDRWLLQANVPAVGAGGLFTSTDGRNWTMLLQSGLFITSVAGRPGAYVATLAANGGLLVSADAVHWDLIADGQTMWAYPTVVLEGYGWFLGGTTSGIVASQNGRDWQWLPGITTQIYGGSRIGQSFWFTGLGGTIIEVMPHTEAPIANLSTRAYQRSDGLPAIAGFIIEGTESVDVLVRAVGAGLRDYDVTEVVERPTLHLFEGQSETMSAGDWATSATRTDIENATRRIGAFELKEDGGDAAFVARLPAGAYTAVVQGGAVTQGNVLVEVYDSGATHGASAGGRLANSSTRGEATAEHPLIGGLIISGDHPRRVLVRGIGPGLLDYDVPSAAADPRLEIFREQATVATNDDWDQGDDPLLVVDASAASHAFALVAGSLDAAIVVTLAPGLYTVHVSPAKGTDGGEVLLETYYLD